MKEFVIYTGLRIGLFVACLVVVFGVWAWVAGTVPLVWAFVISFVLSGLASYFLLNRQRAAFARRVEQRADRMQERFEQLKAKEDVD